MASTAEADEISQAAKDFTVLAKELQENLSKACAKNEALLEAIESSEAKSTEPSSEVPFLRNMRARLAAAHAPNAALRRELSKFMGIFEKRFKELDETTKEYDRLVLALKVEKRNLEGQNVGLQKRKLEHEKERSEWKQKLEDARTEIQDQNDRLAVLADQLSGAKVALDSQTRELASRRLAFEEEKLSREEEEFRASDTEAEELRQRLRQQILKNSELEDKLLRTELALHQKEEVIATMSSSKERLQRDLMQSRQSSTRAVKQFDQRTNEGTSHTNVISTYVQYVCTQSICTYMNTHVHTVCVYYVHLHLHIVCTYTYTYLRIFCYSALALPAELLIYHHFCAQMHLWLIL